MKVRSGGEQIAQSEDMIDATYLKTHRTASSLRVKRGISGA